MTIKNKFDIGDIVNVKEGYGLKEDRHMNPWRVTRILIDSKSSRPLDIMYSIDSLPRPDASTGFYEEALEEVK